MFHGWHREAVVDCMIGAGVQRALGGDQATLCYWLVALVGSNGNFLYVSNHNVQHHLISVFRVSHLRYCGGCSIRNFSFRPS